MSRPNPITQDPIAYSVSYDFGIESGVTGWNLYADGIVLAQYRMWEEADAERKRLKGIEGK